MRGIDFMNIIKTSMLRKERHNIKSHARFQKILSKYISKSKRHLDFGCGFGCTTYLLACEYPEMKVTGMDIRREDINAGRKRYIAPNLKLMVSNKINGKFDTISCFGVLHEIVGDLNYYLKEFHSHLNPHGKVLIFDFRKVSRKKLMKFYYKPRLEELSKEKIKSFNLKSFDEEYEHHCKWTVKQFVSMFEKVGFKTLEIKLDEIALEYIGEKR